MRGALLEEGVARDGHHVDEVGLGELRERGVDGEAADKLGEEAVAVGGCVALNEDDQITSTHRGHGHCVAKGADFKRMFCELLGKEEGYCRGKGGSMHIADQDNGNLGANAIVGGSAGIATGAALSAKKLKTGAVTVCFFVLTSSIAELFPDLSVSLSVSSSLFVPVIVIEGSK